MIIKIKKKLPRLLVLRSHGELTAADYRSLQSGEAVEVSDELGKYLLQWQYAESADAIEKEGADVGTTER